MVIDATAADLAFHAARIVLSADALRPDLPLALDQGPPVGPSPVITALETAPKPVRVSGTVVGAVLRLHLSSPSADPETSARYGMWRRLEYHPPFPESTPQRHLLVVAFDHLLLAPQDAWRQFLTDYWIDGPFCWSADNPGSMWARELHIPEPYLEGIGLILLFGYGAVNQIRSPVDARTWEAA